MSDDDKLDEHDADRGGKMHESAHAITDELALLAARRWRVAISLTGVMMTTYFGFIFLVAYAKSVTSILVTPGLSLGILLGALVIIVAWIVTGIYVRWANTQYDVRLAELRALAAASATKREESVS